MNIGINTNGLVRSDAPETSHEAAEQANTGTWRARVYAAIMRAGPHGLTDEEIAQRVPGIHPNAIRPRRRELIGMGVVEGSEAKRKTPAGRNAIVWVAKTAAEATTQPESQRQPQRGAIPLAEAIRAVERIIRALGASQAPCEELRGPMAVGVCGSIRRTDEWVSTIDLLASMPDRKDHDPLYDALNRVFERGQGAELFGAQQPPTHLGCVDHGLSSGFKSCYLMLNSPQIPVHVHRFDSGPTGNLGWISLIRTGPSDFARALMHEWNRTSRGGYTQDGYPHTRDGAKVPVPSELEAFELIRRKYLNPRERSADAILVRT